MIKFPFTTLQQCNLDWIMQQLHKILDFMPLNGSPGDVLQRNVDGAAWMPISAVSMDIHGLNTIADVSPADELPIYDNSLQGNFKVSVSDLLDNAPVQSVNGQTGDVILDAVDVGALPDTTVIPDSTSDLVNDSGFVDAAGAAAAAPVQSVNGQTGNVVVSGGAVDSVNGQTGTVILGKSDVGLGNVDNVQQYSANNPPPYPVTSVNGQTGAVVVGGGSGIDILGGTSGSCTMASHAGIGQASDISNLNWRLSSDKKWIMLYGWFTLTFNTTGDVTLIDLGGFTLNSTGATAYYQKGAVDLVNSSGQINLSASKGSSFLRLSNNVLRISLDDPGTTGTFTVMVHPVLLQMDT